LQFLAERQLPSGQFPVVVTFHYQEGSPSEQDEALFATTHIVHSLGFLPDPLARTMISRALAYFQAEMNGPGLWRHWNREAVRDGRRLYPFIPADLDDMAGVSALLKRHGVRFPDNRALMLLNRNRAGRFYTWLLIRPTPTLNLHYWRVMLSEITLMRLTAFWAGTEAGYHDVDGVVNANVLLYLGERAETRPVIDWLIEIVQNGEEVRCDKWYRDRFTFYYALSRNYYAGIAALGRVRAQIVTRLEEAAHDDGRIGDSALHTALAANTLLDFGERSPLLERALTFLIETQSDEGSWPSAPYYYGGPQMTVAWGSDELTTGLCLEALQRSQCQK
jgi:hypothetical protein